jgi:murein DD-endopeptidase MepM/ murein hydrolase activator NlpD
VASLDPSVLRQTPPVTTPPPVEDDGIVRFGDTVLKLAQRYGLSVAELIRLNPGLETARLVVGSQVRLAQSAPGRSRLLLGLKPSVSGGMSWPDTPEFGDPQPPFRGGTTSPSTSWIWPTQGMFSSGFGWRWGRMHKGIDVANNVGTPIVAAREGQVAFAGWHDGGYGYLVEILHPDGSRSLYAHNSRLLVSKGDMVAQGQVISQMGSTGRSTGPHLHFEIHPPGKGAVNPLQMLPPRA